jgi:hypothetical protein
MLSIDLDVARNCEYKVIQGENHKDTHNYHTKEQAEANHANCVIDFVCFFEEVFHVFTLFVVPRELYITF